MTNDEALANIVRALQDYIRILPGVLQESANTLAILVKQQKAERTCEQPESESESSPES